MPKIFYWMINVDKPAGGEKHLYEHVDLLNEAGFEAYGFHLTGGRYTWFASDTPLVCGGAFWDRYDPAEDYLVLPELLGPLISTLPGRKVIFNRGIYYGFSVFNLDAAFPQLPYQDPRVVAVFGVSEHNCRHLRFAFPQATVYRMYSSIDPRLYAYRPLREKKKRILVGTKATPPLSVLVHTLRARASAGLNKLAEYQVTFLKNLPLDQAATAFNESLLFITLATWEGLPRVLLEAMASGCLIVGYGTGSMAEIMPPEYACEPDDLIAMAQRIETILASSPEGLEAWTETTERARATAAAFTLERQRHHLIDAWRDIFATHSAPLAVASASSVAR